MVVVVGTKLDLLNQGDVRRQREVSQEEGEAYARQINAVFYETSAKENINVSQVFDRIGFRCLASKLTSESTTGPETTSGWAPREERVAKPCCVLQ